MTQNRIEQQTEARKVLMQRDLAQWARDEVELDSGDMATKYGAADNAAEEAAERADEAFELAVDAEYQRLSAHDNPVNSKCLRCAGTGQFVTGIENGKPTGPGGICFRCGGKGFQTETDAKRNWGYDNFAPRDWR